MLKKLPLAVLALLFATHVCAVEVLLEKAWVRATAPGQETAMVDLQISSAQAARLISVSTPVAASVELHRMSTDNGVMKMREVKQLALPAGQVVDLGEAGLHLMLLGLKAPIQLGMPVPLTLKIQLADKKIISVNTSAEVKPLVEIKADAHQHHH
ncbi:MAG: copper chaperone PCu(A)C [Sideroxydans sp.]|nr:copper chaperone PCu(A)C [Sideroxydans sp.]